MLKESWQLQADPTRTNQYAASTDGDIPITVSSVGLSPPIELNPTPNASSKHPVAMTEQAEDIMDITKEGGEEAPENPSSSSPKSPVMSAESESEEAYEPPPSIDHISDHPIVQSASQQQFPKSGQNTRQPSSNSRHLEPETDANPLFHALALNGVDSGDGLATSRGQSSADNSDSDDYEPPEPISPMETTPLALDTTGTGLNGPLRTLEADVATRVESEAPTSNFDDQGHIADDPILIPLPEQVRGHYMSISLSTYGL